MYCGNCGADVPEHLRFCTNCGTPIDNEETRVATETTGVAQPRAGLARADLPGAITPRANVLPDAPRPDLPRTVAPPDESVIFTVRPTFLFVGVGYILAALGAILLTVLFALYIKSLPAVYALPVALLLLLIPAWKHLKRNALKYTLTDAKLEIDEGLFSRRTRNIPLRNIQDVTVAATITQRLLGFGNVLIDNAGDQGDTALHNIPKPRRHAELILRELRRWH
jgi:membrane protein YdbS with pleckstrin-like domain